MNKQYSAEFKLETIKRIERIDESVSKVAEDPRVRPTTMQGWVKKHKQSPNTLFLGSGNLSLENEKLRKFKREN